jgi:hypothetical protein
VGSATGPRCEANRDDGARVRQTHRPRPAMGGTMLTAIPMPRELQTDRGMLLIASIAIPLSMNAAMAAAGSVATYASAARTVGGISTLMEEGGSCCLTLVHPARAASASPKRHVGARRIVTAVIQPRCHPASHVILKRHSNRVAA